MAFSIAACGARRVLRFMWAASSAKLRGLQDPAAPAELVDQVRAGTAAPPAIAAGVTSGPPVCPVTRVTRG